MKKVLLYFGSFNPVHVGHLALANYIVEQKCFDELWFVVSPQNPFKQGNVLMPDALRLDLVRRAIAGYSKFDVTDVEFSLPKPSYTYNTLTELAKRHPDVEFSLLMGADNLSGFSRWKNFQWILDNHDVYVYPRPGCAESEASVCHDRIKFMGDAPQMEISSTFIREALRKGQDIRYFLHPSTWEVVSQHPFFKEEAQK